jgi:hypothetical protein
MRVGRLVRESELEIVPENDAETIRAQEAKSPSRPMASVAACHSLDHSLTTRKNREET